MKQNGPPLTYSVLFECVHFILTMLPLLPHSSSEKKKGSSFSHLPAYTSELKLQIEKDSHLLCLTSAFLSEHKAAATRHQCFSNQYCVRYSPEAWITVRATLHLCPLHTTRPETEAGCSGGTRVPTKSFNTNSCADFSTQEFNLALMMLTSLPVEKWKKKTGPHVQWY